MSIAPSTLRFMFVPGTFDTYLGTIMEEAGDEEVGVHDERVGVQRVTAINSLRLQINNRRMAIVVCTVATIAFVALAITLTSLPAAIILAAPLVALPIIGFLTAQLYCRAADIRSVMMGTHPVKSDDDSDTEL